MSEADDGIWFEAEASGIAFLLISGAFHELAIAVRTAEPERGADLLRQLELGVAITVAQFRKDRPDLADDDVLHVARERVRNVMRAAQGLGSGESSH